MIGIPYRLLREGEDGPVDKVVFLATRRGGEAGVSMTAAKQEYRKAQKATLLAYQGYMAAGQSLKELPVDSLKRPGVLAERNAQSALVLDVEDEALEAAEKVVRLSLKANYGAEEAEALMDTLSDNDLHGIVATLQMGEQPKDFFPSGAARGKSTGTLPVSEPPPASSSNTDSPGAT